MTHKNIVRYYQAWVDGEGEQENDVTENANPELDTVGNDVLEIVEGVGEDSDDEDNSGQGWWASAPDKTGGKGRQRKVSPSPMRENLAGAKHHPVKGTLWKKMILFK
jgi:hypothetical protein